MSDVVPDSFTYEMLDEETRMFVQQKADEIHGQLKRTAQGVLLIGHNLLAVKERLEHGRFLPWLQREFGMTEMSAVRFMQVAKRFGESKSNKLLDLPVSILYQLAAPSTPESIVHQVQLGVLPATRDAIHDAKKKLQEAETAKEEALLREETVRQRLERAQAQSQEELGQLNQQIKALHQHLADVPQPLIEIKEVVKEVIPPNVQAQLERVAHLQETIERLTHQRDALAEKARVLGEEAQDRYLRTQREREDQQRLHHWRGVARTFHGAIETIVARLPSPVDLERFEAEDWQWVSQVKEDARRLLAACETLERPGPGSIVDASP